MLTVSLVTLFVLAVAAVLLVLVDSWLRGITAYGSLRLERSRIAAQGCAARVVTFSVWTGEHAPARDAMRSSTPLSAAA
jgi:hypothetical protein